MIATVLVLGTSCVGTTGRNVLTTTETKPPTTESTVPEPDCAESLSPAVQAGQLLMVMVPAAGDATELLASGSVGGLGLKGRQPADVGDAITAAIEDAPIPPFVSSDEEGGTTQRLSAALGSLPSAEEMAKGTPIEAGELMGAYAEKMKEIGFNMVFGPVADTGTGSALGSRSFGDDPEKVAEYVTSIVEAIQSAGLVAVVKHWPGIGGGTSDPHDMLSSLDPIEELRQSDLIPFRAAITAHVGGIMVSHSVVPGLTADDEPASISRTAITGELRGALDYQGLVMTDSLGMGAIVATTPQEEAAEKAISAGADIALVSGVEATEKAHARLTDAIRTARLDPAQVERSVRRVLAAKGISGPCPDIVANSVRSAERLPEGADTDGATGTGNDSGTSEGTGAGNEPDVRSDDGRGGGADATTSNQGRD